MYCLVLFVYLFCHTGRVATRSKGVCETHIASRELVCSRLPRTVRVWDQTLAKIASAYMDEAERRKNEGRTRELWPTKWRSKVALESRL